MLSWPQCKHPVDSHLSTRTAMYIHTTPGLTGTARISEALEKVISVWLLLWIPCHAFFSSSSSFSSSWASESFSLLQCLGRYIHIQSKNLSRGTSYIIGEDRVVKPIRPIRIKRPIRITVRPIRIKSNAFFLISHFLQ